MISPAGESPSRTRRSTLFYRLGLANKFLVTTLVLLVVLGVAGSVVFWRILRSRLTEEFASTTRLVATEAATRAAPLLARGDREALADLLRGVKSMDESIAYALLLDRDGEIVAHTFDWDPPEDVLGGVRAHAPLGVPDYRLVDIGGESCLDVAAPVLVDARGAGSLQIGIRTDRIDRFVNQMNVVFLLVLLGLTGIGLAAARAFYRRMARPVVELTRLADEVSVGKLDVRFDIGLPVKCWEIKECGQTDCAAYGNTSVQCWFVDGTPCEGYEPRFPQKLAACRNCEVYQAHKGDEIVQLADSFHHMTHVVRTSRLDLERSDRFLRGLIRNSYIGIIATDEADVVQVFNRVAQDLTGYAEDEVVGQKSWEALFDPDSSARWRERGSQGSPDQIFGFYRREMALRRKDGGTADVRATGTVLREDGRTVGKVFFVMDLREVNSLREDLIRSERLAATGQTVASISHAIKNILDGLRGGAYIYRSGLRAEDADARRRGWSMVERNIDLISALVFDLLSFAGERRSHFEVCDPRVLVADVVDSLAQRAEAHGVTVDVRYDPSGSRARLDVSAMHQCLGNLITNAIDAAATNEGGRVSVSASMVGEDQLEFEITDDGPGVPPEVAETLFSGMVSTKGSKGTGLGLLVVHKIVGEHGGTVGLDPTSGRGATFRVRIPLNESSALAPEVR